MFSSVLALLLMSSSLKPLEAKVHQESFEDKVDSRPYLRIDNKEESNHRSLLFCGSESPVVEIISPSHQHIMDAFKPVTVSVSYDAKQPLFGFLFGFREIMLSFDDQPLATRQVSFLFGLFASNSGVAEMQIDPEMLQGENDGPHLLKASGNGVESPEITVQVVRDLPDPDLPQCDKVWFTVPIYAVQASDDDGQRVANITPAQVQQWIDQANLVYDVACVRFTFDGKLHPITDTHVNSVTGIEYPQWQHVMDTLNAIANTQHKLTVVFRHGDGVGPIGGGFSWWTYDFVAMPAFSATSLCGNQNIGIMAHEMGT